MSTNIVTREQQTAIAKQAEIDPFVRYGRAASRTRIVGQLLKFKKGQWVAGENNDRIPEGTTLVAHMEELHVGWVKWEDAKPVEQIMGRIIDNYEAPPRSSLGDTDRSLWPSGRVDGMTRDPWQFSNYLIMLDPETGQLYTFATASHGGLQALAKLSEAFGQNRTVHPDELPIVMLGRGGYDHPNPSFGYVETPAFPMAGWMDRSVMDAAMAARDGGDGWTDPADEEGETPPTDEPPRRSVPRPIPQPQPDYPQPAARARPASNDYRATPPAKLGPSAAKLPKTRF